MSNMGPPKISRPRDGARQRVYFNGKFYSGGMNGVHRVADRLLREIDALADEQPEMSGWDMRLLVPERSNWSPDFKHIRKLPQRLGHTQAWEQCMLPFAAADGALVSLANLAPFLHRRKVTMVHDAQFRISPESYPLKLRIGYRWLIPFGAATSRRVLTVSDYARDSLAMFGIASRANIALVRNAGEHILETEPIREISDRLGLSEKPFCLLFGSPAIYKNNRIVFDAFRRQQLVGVKLVVIGCDRERLLRSGFVPPADAIFAGSLSDGELRALYEDALCLLFPSRTEGFGLPPLEAMICGCPVISAPSGAMPEVCGDAILYADHSDPDAWVRQIAALIGSAALRDLKIAAGHKRAAMFGWKKAGEQLIAHIADVLRHESPVHAVARANIPVRKAVPVVPF